MYTVRHHPVLPVRARDKTQFSFHGKIIEAEKGYTVAAALHRAGYPVHSHSLKGRNRSLECGIGKCGACEMLVDGQVKRICITRVDNVTEVMELPTGYKPETIPYSREGHINVYRTDVAIIGAGPAGLAAREVLNQYGIPNVVIDNNDRIGGQFLMQTHQFFFFEKEKKYGGMRGFEIANMLAGENPRGIFLDCTVWDILEGKRLAVKNINSGDIFYIDADYLIVATGAVPFMPAFENDDLPGVYTAAVVQKMMNIEFTLLGKNVLTVGAGNIGYLTSYQLMQAGARVKAIIEARPFEGGFPVQANRVRRLGIPIITSHMLMKTIPNRNNDGIVGAVVAECKDFVPVPGTEKIIEGIDTINICTGLVQDDQLLIKGNEVFGRNCFGAGDAIRIGEGTSAVLRGKQAACEIAQDMGVRINYDAYLELSKEYIDSQQHPVKVIETPFIPDETRRTSKPFVLIDCTYGFACNPCQFACPHDAITKTSSSTIPYIDFEKCTGCMSCVYQCPGLAIFGYDLKKNNLYFPVEFDVEEQKQVFLVDNNGRPLGEGTIEKVMRKPNKTHIARIKSANIAGDRLMEVRGFILKDQYPEPVKYKKTEPAGHPEKYICHCDDVTLDEILETIGDRRFISVDEVKHTTRLGMGACRGKRCIPRLKQILRSFDISLIGDATPRGPLSNQIAMGELYPRPLHERIIPCKDHQGIHKTEVCAVVAGGGMGGSALFRYLAEAGQKPVLINTGRGASWRNIAAGRPNFSVPELAEIAVRNLEIFRELQRLKDVNFRQTRYITFAHDEEMIKSLEASLQWTDGYMIEVADFRREISPHFNPSPVTYLGAQVTNNCWQATPGKVIDLIRRIGLNHGGTVMEDCVLISVEKEGDHYRVLVRDHHHQFIEYKTPVFINALGPGGESFARMLGIHTGLYPVKHQAFITRRLPFLGTNGQPLDMLIDRRKYKGFSAVYGQQLGETGQIIGCASPAVEPHETGKNLKVNSREFIEIAAEIFIDWLPELSSVGFQAIWAGYYVEPRMIIDTEHGLFLGLRGQGFMLSQYLAKMYVDQLTGKTVPAYFNRLKLTGDGMPEKTFK